MSTPSSIWAVPDTGSYFSPRYGYWMARDPDCGTANHEAQRELAQNHLGILLVCRQMYAECRLLPFMVNSFSFDSAARMTRWLGRLNQEQRDAVQALQLDYVWSRKTGLRHGNAAPAATPQELAGEVRGLKRVEVRVVYQDSLARTAEGTDEWARVLGMAMVQWKIDMRRERRDVHVEMRAVGRDDGLINRFEEVFSEQEAEGGQL